MAEDTAAMDALDEAIRRFTAEALGRDGIVNGWVIAISTIRYGDGDEPFHAFDYTTGPMTTIVGCVGLLRLAQLRMEQDILGTQRGEDSEDD